MLKLGTRVEYANQTGQIVGRTIELQPKYDIMLANGTIRSYVRESDLVILPQSAANPGRRSGALGSSDEPAISMEHTDVAKEGRDADPDRGR